MLNIGLILPDLSMSQLAFMAINQANLFHGNTDIACTLFYCDANQPCVEPKVPIMNITEIHGFHGLLISTDIDSTLASIRAASKATRVFYVWDLEWIRRGKNNFQYNMQAFRHPKVHIATRSEEHARAVSQYANRDKVLVVPHLNLMEIVNLVEKT